MSRFAIHLGNDLIQLVWADSHKQAEQHARNLASYYATFIEFIEEHRK